MSGHPGDGAPVAPVAPVALVTGGAGAGIGAGVSRALAGDGWHVAVADLDPVAAQAVSEEIRAGGGLATPFAVDVGDPDAPARLTDEVTVACGPIGALVNSAGVGAIRRVGDATVADWDRIMSVDLRGAWLVSRAVLPGMVARGHGVIVTIGSVQALGAAGGYGLYAAAKAGVTALTRAIACDYGPDGIRAVVVHPGLVDSPQNRDLFATWGDPEDFIHDYLTTRQFLPRLLTPADVGATVAFLVSDAAAGITGTEVVVDGGSSAMAFDRRPAAAATPGAAAEPGGPS